MTRKALVVHPTGFRINGGGEMICLHTIKVLQDLGFKVVLASSVWPEKAAEEHFRMGHLLKDVEWLQLGETALDFRPRFPKFLAYQRFLFALGTIGRTHDLGKSKDVDITISTQSALYFNPNSTNITIVYDTADFFFTRNFDLWSMNGSSRRTPKIRKLKFLYYRPLRAYYQYHERLLSSGSTLFVPLSRYLENKLVELNYPHSQTLFPPCDLIFKPRAPKRKLVVQSTRIVPSKKLEDFLQIARKLPEYEFCIVGKYSESERKLFGDYPQRLFRQLPGNVVVVNEKIRNRPDLLEEAKVYLYTSIEPGVNIGTVEALGAGCYPITPSTGGGAEIVEATRVGATYGTLDEGVARVKEAMEGQIDPQSVARSARIFSSDHFEEAMARLISNRVGKQ